MSYNSQMVQIKRNKFRLVGYFIKYNLIFFFIVTNILDSYVDSEKVEWGNLSKRGGKDGGFHMFHIGPPKMHRLG